MLAWQHHCWHRVDIGIQLHHLSSGWNLFPRRGIRAMSIGTLQQSHWIHERGRLHGVPGHPVHDGNRVNVYQ
jgi:hypothetical protein